MNWVIVEDASNLKLKDFVLNNGSGTGCHNKHSVASRNRERRCLMQLHYLSSVGGAPKCSPLITFERGTPSGKRHNQPALIPQAKSIHRIGIESNAPPSTRGFLKVDPSTWSGQSQPLSPVYVFISDFSPISLHDTYVLMIFALRDNISRNA